MYRRFFTATHKQAAPQSRNPALSTFTASPVVHPHNSLLFKPQNHADHCRPSLHLITLQNSIDKYKLSELQLQLLPSSEVYEFLVSQYQNSRSLDDPKNLHLQILKSGFSSDVYLNNTLINVYVSVGNLVSASKLFDEMPERNSVTWASLISGYTKNGMLNEACLHFKRMICTGFFPNRYAFGSALRACHEYGPSRLELGKQIHGLLSKTWYDLDMVVGNVLISMYGNCLGSIDDARRVFEEIQMKNSISWNSIISAYSHRGDTVSAFELFSTMQRQGCGFSLKPNEFTFGSLITAASYLANHGLTLLEQMLAKVNKCGFLEDLYVGSSLVSGFSKFGLVNYALKIFEQMSERNSVSMNGLMVGLVRQKQGKEATGIFTYMKDLVGANLDSYVVLLSSFAEFSDLEEGKRKGQEVHAFVIRFGFVDTKVAIGNGLVNMYSKCSAITYACSVFRQMVDKDLVSWNTMISGLHQNGCFEDAAICFCEMRRFGWSPSNFTLISALSSCASLGWILLGQQIQGGGVKLGLDLDVSVSNALLLLYAETGRLNECHQVFFLMPKYDQVSWNSIIGALGNFEASVSDALEYFINMMRAGWSPNRLTFMSILGAVSSLSLTKLVQQIHATVLKHPIANDSPIENALLACYGKFSQVDDCEKVFSKVSERRDEVGIL